MAINLRKRSSYRCAYHMLRYNKEESLLCAKRKHIQLFTTNPKTHSSIYCYIWWLFLCVIRLFTPLYFHFTFPNNNLNPTISLVYISRLCLCVSAADRHSTPRRTYAAMRDNDRVLNLIYIRPGGCECCRVFYWLIFICIFDHCTKSERTDLLFHQPSYNRSLKAGVFVYTSNTAKLRAPNLCLCIAEVYKDEFQTECNHFLRRNMMKVLKCRRV